MYDCICVLIKADSSGIIKPPKNNTPFEGNSRQLSVFSQILKPRGLKGGQSRSKVVQFKL